MGWFAILNGDGRGGAGGDREIQVEGAHVACIHSLSLSVAILKLLFSHGFFLLPPPRLALRQSRSSCQNIIASRETRCEISRCVRSVLSSTLPSAAYNETNAPLVHGFFFFFPRLDGKNWADNYQYLQKGIVATAGSEISRASGYDGVARNWWHFAIHLCEPAIRQLGTGDMTAVLTDCAISSGGTSLTRVTLRRTSRP